MYRFRNITFAALLAIGSTLPNRAPAADEPSDLRSLQRRLEAVHPSLRALRARLRAARADLVQQGRKPNPSLGLDIEELGGSAGGTPAEAAWNLTWSQALEARSLRRARRIVARSEVERIELELETQRRELHGKLARAWYRVLAERIQWSQRTAALALLQEGVAAVRSRYEAGAASQLELDRESNEAFRLEADTRESLTRVAVAQRRLAILLQEDIETSPSASPIRLPSLELPSLKEALVRLKSHPAVEASRAGARGAKAAVDRVWAERRGERELEAGFRRKGQNGATLTLGMRIPLRIHDKKGGAMKAARARWEEARAEIDVTLLRFEERIVELHGELESRKVAFEVLDKRALPTALSALDLALEGYQRGKFTFLEFLEAQKALVALRGRLAELQGESCAYLGEWFALLGSNGNERSQP